MTKPKSQLAVALRKKGPPHRSEIFYWLREHYHEVADALNGPAPNWVEVATRAEAEGKLGANGQPQPPRAVRKIWLRVCRMMELEEAAKLERRLARKPPNRSSQRSAGRHEVTRTTHRDPVPVRAPEPAHHPPEARSLPGSAQRPQAPAPKSKLRLEDLPPEARAQLEKLDRGLAEFDRKRFG